MAEQAAGAIPTLQAQLATFAGVDWQRMAVEQPAVHAQARTLFDSLSQQLQQAETAQVEAAAAAELQQHRSAEEQRRYISGEKQALMATVPEMADPAQAPREAAALHRYLAESGYAPPEIARLVDHRDFVLARKAMLYDRLMASSAKGREKLAARRPRPTAGRGAATPHWDKGTPRQADDAAVAQRQHRRCGKADRDDDLNSPPAHRISAPAALHRITCRQMPGMAPKPNPHIPTIAANRPSLSGRTGLSGRLCSRLRAGPMRSADIAAFLRPRRRARPIETQSQETANMAQPTNTFDSYDSIGNKDDLSEVIYNICRRRRRRSCPWPNG